MNNTKKSKSNRTILILVILLIIGIVIDIYGDRYHKNNDIINNDSQIISDDNAIDWHGNQRLNGYGQPSDKISIPCFDGLVFQANQTSQKVNLYNPENNSCYMKFSIIVENKTIWKSEMVAPAKGFYEIELNDILTSGTYKAYLLIECFDMNNKSPMNNGLNEFTLYVQ